MNDRDINIERMVNQIAAQFTADASSQAAANVAEHVGKFWNPSMRGALVLGVTEGRMQVLAAVDEAIQQGLITADHPSQ